jgi:hypothetical protein
MLHALLWDNPLIIKHRRSRLRLGQLLPLMIIVVLLAASVVWGMGTLGLASSKGLFQNLLGLQVVILLLLGSSQVATAVTQARECGILDFHRASPQPPLALACGFLFGGPIREYVLFACTLPFVGVLLAAPEPGLLNGLLIELLLVGTAIVTHAGVLMVGLTLTRTHRASSGIVVLVVLGTFFTLQFVGTPLAPLVAFYSLAGLTVQVLGSHSGMLERIVPWFSPVPTFLLSLVHLVPLGMIFMSAAVHKLHRDQAPLFTKPAALASFAVLLVLTVIDLLVVQRLEASGIGEQFSLTWLLYLGTFGGMLLCHVATPAGRDLLAGLRRARKLLRPHVAPWGDDSGPLRLALWCAGLLLLTMGGLLYGWREALDAPAAMVLGRGTDGWLSAPGHGGLLGAGIGSAVVLYTTLAWQSCQILWPKQSTSAYGLFLFLCWVLPLIGTLLVLPSLLTAGVAKGALVASIAGISPLAGLALALNAATEGLLARGAYVAAGVSLLLLLGCGYAYHAALRRLARQVAAEGR